jgi:hypothetical protein
MLVSFSFVRFVHLIAALEIQKLEIFWKIDVDKTVGVRIIICPTKD